jgi:hypothetical protein
MQIFGRIDNFTVFFVSDKYFKLLTFKTFYLYIFYVLMNRSFMDFLFHVPFFCTAAAGAVAEIQTVCFVNMQKAFCRTNNGLSLSSAQTARINST